MQVKLKKNGWHRKLQEFVFKNPPVFYNFCPYFWLTIFCILITFIFPIIPLAKGIKYLFLGLYWIGEKCLESFNDYICEPFFEWVASNMPEEDVMKAWTVNNDWYGRWRTDWDNMSQEEKDDYNFWRHDYLGHMSSITKDKYNSKFQLWKKKNPDWESKIQAMKDRQKELWKEKMDRLEKAAEENRLREIEKAKKRAADKEKNRMKEYKKQKMFNNIVKYTKYIAYALGIAVLAIALFGVYRLFYWVYEVVNWTGVWSAILQVAPWVGLAFLSLAVGVGTCYLIVMLFKKCKISISDIPGMKKLGNWLLKGSMWFFNNILEPFADWGDNKAIPWLASGFSFLWMYIKTFKENNCPGIVYVDEDGKES